MSGVKRVLLGAALAGVLALTAPPGVAWAEETPGAWDEDFPAMAVPTDLESSEAFPDEAWETARPEASATSEEEWPEVSGVAATEIEPEASAVAATPDPSLRPVPTRDVTLEEVFGGEPERGGITARERETARERLNRLAREKQLAKQQRRVEADSIYRAGRELYEDQRYEEARRQFEQALAVDPEHREARRHLERCRAIIGITTDETRGYMARVAREERVRLQQALVEIELTLERARIYHRNAERLRPWDYKRDFEAIYTRAMRDLEKAMEHYSRALELMTWLPYQVDLSGSRAAVERGVENVTLLRHRLNEARERFQRKRAYVKAVGEITEVKKHREKQLRLLKASAEELYRGQRYEEAEEVAVEILRMKPLDNWAEKLKFRCRDMRRARFWRDDYYDRRDRWKASMLEVEESAIPYDTHLIYPANWVRVLERVKRDITIKREEPWKDKIRSALRDQTVSFEFDNQPLSEVIDFIRRLAPNINIVVHRDAANQMITLSVRNMTLGTALRWVLKMANLDYTLKNGALFIAPQGEIAQTEEPILKLYDVSDLVFPIPDFPAPDFAMPMGATAGGAGGEALTVAEEAGGVRVTMVEIIEMVRSKIQADWNNTAAVEERGNHLVVLAPPEIHRAIDKLLADFRKAEKLMVMVEARFLEIREGFFEEIGMDWGGLERHDARMLDWGPPTTVVDPAIGPDPRFIAGGLYYDSGIGNELPNIMGPGMAMPMPAPAGGGPALPVNPRAGISTLWSEALGDPYPGIEAGFLFPRDQTVDYFGRGVLDMVGAVMVNDLNYSAEPTPIGTFAVPRQLIGGLNGQITHIGRMQAQALLHALRVREKGSVLTAPRLTMMNLQRASMFVAVQQAYISGYSVSAEGAATPTVDVFLHGVMLDVRPIVSADRKYITLEIRPTLTELLNIQQLTIDSTFIRDSGGIGGEPVLEALTLPIMLPILRITQVRTTVVIPDGGIILCGGLMRDIKYTAETGVPVARNLPIIGRLFRWNVIDNEKSNLVILMTARVIMLEEEEEKAPHAPAGPLGG